MDKAAAVADPAPNSHGSGSRLLEADLANLWYQGALCRRGLRTRCGRRVRVLYRGIPNGGSGPDYRGAVLSLGRGKPRTGDIELHVRASQWREHGHHRDPGYDGVILHVVWNDDDTSPTCLSNGREAPVLAIHGVASRSTGAPVLEPCRAVAEEDARHVAEALDRAGEARFLTKADGIEGDMAVFPAKEVLYQRLAESMGYSQNREAFQRLAIALPLNVLESFLWARTAELREEHAKALLLGMAGLLDRGPDRLLRAGHDPAELVEIWNSTHLEPQLTPTDWHFGVRPGNHPVRRIAGLASLIASTIEQGLDNWAVNAGAAIKEMGTRSPRRSLLSRPLFPSSIGQDRGLEVAVNVLLPFAYAWGQASGDEGLSRAAYEAYRLLPAPGSNQVVRHMSLQIMGAIANTGGARRQQGLLHFFHSYCTRARCTECALSHL